MAVAEKEKEAAAEEAEEEEAAEAVEAVKAEVAVVKVATVVATGDINLFSYTFCIKNM